MLCEQSEKLSGDFGYNISYCSFYVGTCLDGSECKTLKLLTKNVQNKATVYII